MTTAQDIENKIKQLMPIFINDFNINKIGYFGSFSRGEQTENSDIDIFVEFSITPGWEFF